METLRDNKGSFYHCYRTQLSLRRSRLRIVKSALADRPKSSTEAIKEGGALVYEHVAYGSNMALKRMIENWAKKQGLVEHAIG